MNCPQCNGSCHRDEVDIGVGIQYGPWRCEECAWYEGHQFDNPQEQSCFLCHGQGWLPEATGSSGKRDCDACHGLSEGKEMPAEEIINRDRRRAEMLDKTN